MIAELAANMTYGQIIERVKLAEQESYLVNAPLDIIGQTPPPRMHERVESEQKYADSVCEDAYSILVGAKERCKHQKELEDVAYRTLAVIKRFKREMTKLEDNYLFWYVKARDTKQELWLYRVGAIVGCIVFIGFATSQIFGWF